MIYCSLQFHTTFPDAAGRGVTGALLGIRSQFNELLTEFLKELIQLSSDELRSDIKSPSMRIPRQRTFLGCSRAPTCCEDPKVMV